MKNWKQFWQVKQNRKLTLVFAAAVLFLIAAILMNFCLGAAKLSFADVFDAMKNGVTGVAGRIFWYARFPRTIACLLAGADRKSVV